MLWAKIVLVGLWWCTILPNSTQSQAISLNLAYVHILTPSR